MFRLIAFTQDYENYGLDSDRDYWKPKGGSEVVVAELTVNEAARGYTYLRGLVEAARDQIEISNRAFESNIIDWVLLEPGELTEDEKNQMKYEGKITFPAQKVRLAA